MVQLPGILEFEWDEGNLEKNYKKHQITPKEAEEVFVSEESFYSEDIKHAQKEKRFILVGKTRTGKQLLVVYTVRDTKIRIISARRMHKKIPSFKTEKAEREFWQKVDATEYVDFSTFKRVSFPNLRLSSKPITIRLPESLIDQVKIKAHQMDVPYQSLIKQLIFKGLNTL